MSNSGAPNGYAQIRTEYRYVLPEEWAWAKDQWLFGSQYIDVALLISSPYVPFACEMLRNHAELHRFKVPYRIRVAVVLSEDPRDPQVAKDIHAEDRIYRFFSEKRADGSMQGKRLDRLMAAGPAYCREHGIPFAFVNPKRDNICDALVRNSAATGKRAFHMVISNPWGGYHQLNVRRYVKEVSSPDFSRPALASGAQPSKIEYLEREDCTREPLFGWDFGLHPQLEVGSRFGLGLMAGMTPLDYFVKERVDSIRLALMGIGPGQMDNPEFWIADGPSMNANITWPPRRSSADEMLAYGYRYMEMTRQLTASTICRTLGHAIAQRVHVHGAYHLSM